MGEPVILLSFLAIFFFSFVDPRSALSTFEVLPELASGTASAVASATEATTGWSSAAVSVSISSSLLSPSRVNASRFSWWYPSHLGSLPHSSVVLFITLTLVKSNE